METEMVQTGARFPVEILDQLREIADDEERSINNIINRAVREFLERRQ